MLEKDKRYKAVLRTLTGISTVGFFEDEDKAHRWIMARMEESASAERGVRIYDQRENNRHAFEMDPHFLFVGHNDPE